MTHAQLLIDGVDVSFKDMTVELHPKGTQIDTFTAELPEKLSIRAFADVVIKEDGYEVLAGRIEGPPIDYGIQGVNMSLQGYERVIKLKDYKVPYSSIRGATPTAALTTILQDSPYGVGDVDTFEFETDPFLFDTSLEFLAWTYSSLNPTFTTTEELTSEIVAGTYTIPNPQKRAIFWSFTQQRFYYVFHDGTNLKYSSTADFVTFAAVATLVTTSGASGNYGLYWDDTNLHVIVDDAANLDYFRFTASGSTLTQQGTQDNITAGDLICGPHLDSDGHVWFIADDGTNWELWEGTADTTWVERTNWLKSSNDTPKYILPDSTATQMRVIIHDSDATPDELEIWIWSGSWSKSLISAITNDDVGSVSCWQDANFNLWGIAEDEFVAGDADLYCFFAYDGGSWTYEKVIDDDDYQTLGQFSLFGDDSHNLYLFYRKDDGADTEIHIIRKWEGSWETSSTVLDTDCKAGGIQTAETHDACFVMWLDDADDPHTSLMSFYGIAVSKQYADPANAHDYEAGADFDSEVEDPGCSVDASTDWASTGVQSIKCYTDGQASGSDYAFGRYATPWIDNIYHRQVVYVDTFGGVDNGDWAGFITQWNGVGGSTSLYVGWGYDSGSLQWLLRLREGPSFVNYFSGSPSLQTKYCIEVYWYMHATGGICQVWIDGALTFNLSSKDTADYGQVTTLYYGLISINCQNPTRLSFDDVAWDTSDRIGCTISGSAKSASYTRTENLWGTLSATIETGSDVLWDILKASDDSELLTDLTTDVDLNAEGLTEASIKIQTNMEQSLGDNNYVYQIGISEIGGLVDADLDGEDCHTAIKKKMAEPLGAEFELTSAGLVNFKSSIGEDVSDRVVLMSASSQSYDHSKKPNIIQVKRYPDYSEFATRIFVQGAGDPPSRIEATATNAAAEEEYLITKWLTIPNKDMVTVGMAQTFANTQKTERGAPIDRISVKFIDFQYGPGLIKGGNTVYCVNEETVLGEAVRIKKLTINYNGPGQKTMTAELSARSKGFTFLESQKKIDDHDRWLA